jgi:hypothetical protein
MLARPGLAKSVAEVIALARRSPGALRYASAGAGQTIHLCAALFASRAGVELTHVPYASGSMAGLTDLMAGKVDLMFDNALPALPYVHDGKVVALAVAASLALPDLPHVPTLAEAGVAGCEADIWMGLFAPAATAPATLADLQRDLSVVLGQTDLIHELRNAGLMLDVQQGEAFADEIRARNEIADRYAHMLEGLVQTPKVIEGGVSTWAQYVIEADNRDGLAAHLREAGVPTAMYYPKPLHRQTAYESFPIGAGGLKVSETICHRVLALPMHPYLDGQTQTKIANAVRDFVKAGS